MPDVELASEAAQLCDLLCTMNLLAWDARTHMPPGGNTARGHQVATLTALARDCAVGPRMRDAIALARDRSDAMDPDERACLAAFADQVETLRRIPEALLVEMASLKTTSAVAWIAARKANDFSLFSPLLGRIFVLQRELAEAIGYAEHPYDALLGQYEPGMTLTRLQPLFATLREGIALLLQRLHDVAFPDVLRQPYAIEGQRRFAAQIAARLGYDFARGRVDDTIHPFEISMTRDDVRITSRFREDFPQGGLFALWHEAGHGIYEQNVSERWTRGIGAIDLINLYAAGGSSFGLHESQSRLYENRIGRSRQFWELHYGALRDIFPEQLAGVTVDAFWRSVNAPRRGLIRVEADELTYDTHIMLRVELEAALMTGAFAVEDLPALWNERMAQDFGLAVPDLAHGVLQDVHWSSGHVGSFATYTLGNIMSSQFFAAAARAPGVSDGLQEGRYEPLTGWLRQHVHQHGRSRQRDRILHDATGSGLDPAPYLADLRAKTEALLEVVP
ncbi:carboxypeptidase M32 [Lichenicoccus sp.]|uniref:carboxypeptidase M32 n=1 Tax=Lichenicoccus sp. TaxID=2781899 RepID=UPI003D0EDE78